MVNLVASIIGSLGAIVFVGFFAYSVRAFTVNAMALSVIVVVCLALMIYSFYDDMRKDRAIAQLRAKNGRE